MKKRKSEPGKKLSPYPGEHKPTPLDKKKLAKELTYPHEGSVDPLVNMTEEKTLYVIELAAPGLRRDDFLVKVADNRLFRELNEAVSFL